MTEEFESSETFELPDEQETKSPTAEDQAFEDGVNSSLRIEPEIKEEVKTLIAGMTEEELKEVLDKARRVDEINERLTKTGDKAFGKIGQLEYTLNQLKQARESKPITKESFKHLEEYLGEDNEMTEALARDLSELQLGGSAQVIDYDAINSRVGTQLEEISKSFEQKILAVSHPDWQEITIKEYDSNGNPVFHDEFLAWTNTLNDKAKDTVFNSNDGLELSRAFTSYKDWRKKKADYEHNKQQRLDDAIRPRGGAPSKTTSTVNDPFYAGLNSVMNRQVK